MGKIAELLGQPLMPWQRLVADVGGEHDPVTGLPCYREIGVTIHRQAGKTTSTLTFQVDRGLNWGRPQRSAFTAQTGKDARDKWLDEIFPLIEQSKLAPLVQQISKGMGNEALKWKTGSLIRLLSTSASSGHSKTLHQAVLDEIWHDVDDRREQGLRPAMITVPDAQIIWCSTAGTQASTVYNRKVATGRQAVAEDTGSGVAYFEWSAPDDWDPDDEESYFGFMPALCPDPPCRCGNGDGGWRHTITLDVLRSERASMDPAEFRRAYGNRPTGATDMVIPPDLWRRVVDPRFKPAGKLRFGADVAEDRASAAIAAVDAQGVGEVIEHRPGTGWLVERANELTARFGCKVAYDAGGPVGAFGDEFTDGEPLSGRDVIHACASLYDAIVEGRVWFRQDPALDAAVEGVVLKQVGDVWVWSRRASTADVTPLYALTVARRVEEEQPLDWLALDV